MIKVSFTPEIIQTLHQQRFHHPHPRVRLKMEALYLKSQGLPHKDIAKLCGIGQKTFERYLKSYRDGGIEALATVTFNRPQSELAQHQEAIVAALKAQPPATIAQAAQQIESVTGLKRQPTQVRKFLKKLGVKPRKVGSLPAKADVQAQEEFKKKTSSHA